MVKNKKKQKTSDLLEGLGSVGLVPDGHVLVDEAPDVADVQGVVPAVDNGN